MNCKNALLGLSFRVPVLPARCVSGVYYSRVPGPEVRRLPDEDLPELCGPGSVRAHQGVGKQQSYMHFAYLSFS